jgi:hypothetical protein
VFWIGDQRQICANRLVSPVSGSIPMIGFLDHSGFDVVDGFLICPVHIKNFTLGIIGGVQPTFYDLIGDFQSDMDNVNLGTFSREGC